MSDRMHIADTDLTLYALGALPPDVARQIDAHLLGCARCKEELRQNTIALAAYAQTTQEVALPEGAKARFMDRLAKTRPSELAAMAVQAKRASLWSRMFGSGRTGWSPLLAGAFALLLLAVGVDDLHKRAEIGPLVRQARKGAVDSAQLSELIELLASPTEKRVALHPGPVTAPPPEGRVVYAERTGKLLMTASNLHPLPAGKTYELWILQPGGKAPLPAGTFEPDSSGNATLILADEPAGLPVAGFGVTIENAGGSATPTLPIVLSGL